MEQFHFADGTVAADDLTLSSKLIDGAVEGVEYTTSSGLHGFTDENGGFSFKAGDDVTFTIGGVTLGGATAEDVAGGQTFLQDIANVDRTDLNDEYTENMATFLQSLDENGNAYDGIVITDEIRDALADAHIDLRTASEEDVKNLIARVGKGYVDENAAMQHVEDMLVAHTDLDHNDFQEHIDDGNISGVGANDQQHAVISSLPDENPATLADHHHDFQAIEIKVPSVDLARPSDMEMVGGDSDHHSTVFSDSIGANGEEAVAQAHTDTVMTPPQEQLSMDDHSMFSVGDLSADQLPSSIDGDHESGHSPDSSPDQFAGREIGTHDDNTNGHGDHDADAVHIAQTAHDADVHEQHGSLSVAAGDADTHNDNVSGHDNPGPYDHDVSGSETATIADDDSLHAGQAHDPDLVSVGQVPEVVLPDEAHDSLSSVENDEPASLHDVTAVTEGDHGRGQLEHFDVSNGSDPGSDGSLDQFAVSDAGPAMDEVPSMDGLDATPDQQPLPEPEPADAGIGDHDAVIPEDIQHDQDQLHHEVIPA